MKDLTGGALVTQNTINHNKRASQDRTKKENQTNSISAMDTYNKLMQIMNERMSIKSHQSNASRGKSNEKLSKMMQP
jgi:hypothetical protein